MASTPAPPADYAQHKDWKGTKVPPNVFTALETKWRGQSGIGAKQAEILGYFDEYGELKDLGQTTMMAGGSSPPPITCAKNVQTVFKLKAADPSKPGLKAGYGQINPSRMMKHVLTSKDVTDQQKVDLCTGRTAAEPVKWLQQYNDRMGTQPGGEGEEVQTLTAAEIESLTDAEKNARKRQQVLDERVVQKLSAAQLMAVHYALCTFFFVCRIPFLTVEHWAFVAFLKALNPAYVGHMFKRRTLSTTWLRRLRSETEEKTDAALDRTIGKKTLIIDGFKDRRGRHVMNIAGAKVGFAAYVRTAWFGRKQHDGKTYAAEVKSVVGDGDEYIACCADNTSSNTSMQKGLFGQLAPCFMWFYLGCCVHGLDLLSEDVAKLAEISVVIGNCKFITAIVLRFSMLTETFTYLQEQRYKSDKTASKLTLKNFPDTRFAYAFFMIFAVIVNWSVLQSLIDSPEWKLLKRNARPKRRALFKRFEQLIGDASNKDTGLAAVKVMRPISSALHYLEGDDVDASHVLPVYAMLHQCAQKPDADVTDEFSPETLKGVADLFKDRWLGCRGGVRGRGAKIGIRHDVHCLAWKLDLHARHMVLYSATNGAELLAAIDASFDSSAVQRALQTYSKENESTEAKLLIEYEKFLSKTAEYSLKWRSADLIVKNTMPKMLAEISESNKESSITRLIELLKNRNVLIAKTMYKGMAEDPGLSHDAKLFAKMGYEVLSIVTQACAVERINKSHGWVHSKARASMGCETTSDALYIFTNECLIHKKEAKPAVLGSFESFISSLGEPSADLNDVLSTLSNIDVADYLPAERSDAPTTTVRSRSRRPTGSTGEEDDDDEPDHEDEDDEQDEEDENDEEDETDEEDDEDPFVYLPTADIPEGFESVTVATPVTFIPADAIDGLAIMLCCDDLEWMLGKIDKYKPRAKKFQFDVQWRPGHVEQQHVDLDKYFKPETDEPPQAGSWFYIKNSRGSTVSRRRSHPESKNDDEDDGDDAAASWGDHGDDADADGAES